MTEYYLLSLYSELNLQRNSIKHIFCTETVHLAMSKACPHLYQLHLGFTFFIRYATTVERFDGPELSDFILARLQLVP